MAKKEHDFNGQSRLFFPPTFALNPFFGEKNDWMIYKDLKLYCKVIFQVIL